MEHGAVFLRIDAGTQVAAFLSAFCSLDTTPSFVLIKNGTVVEQIAEGVSRDDFVARIMKPLDDEWAKSVETSNEGQQQKSQSPNTQLGSPSKSVTSQAAPLATEPPTIAPSVHPVPSSSQSASRVQDLLAERSARLEAERQEVEKAERDKRRAVAKAKREAAEQEASSSTSIPESRQTYLQQQRSQQREAKTERERILKTIESDKLARKQKEDQRRQLAAAEAGAVSLTASSSRTAAPPSQPTSARAQPTTCSLQLRLFDGSSLRSRFSPSATLSLAVRTYIDTQSTTDIPYTFRQIQTPLPARNISISEENESLQSLGLCPSATLVLVPVKGFTDAYAAAGPTGLLSRGFNLGYGVVSGALGYAGGVLGRATGYGGDGAGEGPYLGGTGDGAESDNVPGSNRVVEGRDGAAAAAAGPGFKIRTLADQRAEQERPELYNGNQLNFEPRRKDDDNGDVK